jgi:magnesium-protoporphyrin IX monomethyl ester (oxidative) cyclase
LRNTARLVKKIFPACPVIAGGVHPTAIPETILSEEPAIDYIVLGEGEDTLLALLKAVQSGEPRVSVEGIAFRDARGDSVINPKTAFIPQLDTLPFPARHLFDIRAYDRLSSAHSGFKQKPYASLISSRGCPAKCTFCSIELLWGKVPRYRSSQNILAEIEMLARKYGVREIHFEDDNLTSNKKRALEIFDGMIQKKLNLSWTVPSGLAIYSLDEELLEKMAASGCYSISLAIESGDQTVLDSLMHKPIRLEKAKPLIDKARSLGMKTKGFFILGFPGETKKTMRKTVDYARSLELDWSLFFMATPLVGTKMYETCKEKGYLKDESVDFARSFYAGNIKTEEFDTEDIEALREEANIDLNFRHNPNLRTYNIDEAVNDFKGVIQFYPHLWFAHFFLGEAYYKKGLKAEAEAEWRKAYVLNPSSEEIRQRVKEMNISV